MIPAVIIIACSLVFLFVLFILKAVIPALFVSFILSAVLFPVFYPPARRRVTSYIPPFLTFVRQNRVLPKTGLALLVFAFTVPLFGVNPGLILAFLVLSYLLRLDPRSSFALALFFLVLTPYFLYTRREGTAEAMAVRAYYFLVVGTLWQVGEMMLEGKRWSIPQMTGYFKRNKAGSLLILAVFIAGLIIAAGVFIRKGKQPVKSAVGGSQETEEGRIQVAPSRMPSVTIAFDELDRLLEDKKKTLRLRILNGTGVPGQAASTAAILREKGFTGIISGNALSSDHLKWEATFTKSDDTIVRYLRDLLGLTDFAVREGTVSGNMDIEIIIGVSK